MVWPALHPLKRGMIAKVIGPGNKGVKMSRVIQKLFTLDLRRDSYRINKEMEHLHLEKKIVRLITKTMHFSVRSITVKAMFL